MDQSVLFAILCVLAGLLAACSLLGSKKKPSAPGYVAPSKGEEGFDEFMPPPDDTQLGKIPRLSVRAGPRDGEDWIKRVKQEMDALLKYVATNKANDTEWFQIAPIDKNFTKWKGSCWYIHEYTKYQFDLEFEIPVSYPVAPFEIVLPELDGKTVKMYRGGKICLSSHFKPLWGKNVPHFGIAHALAMGLGPWLAAEVTPPPLHNFSRPVLPPFFPLASILLPLVSCLSSLASCLLPLASCLLPLASHFLTCALRFTNIYISTLGNAPLKHPDNDQVPNLIFEGKIQDKRK
jgi:ufm1-conjugating enzyme 1